jgi:serine phosphatase RsbU (regulator of sigma subunit)
MNTQQALRILRPILGPKLAYRENPRALTGDELAQAQENAEALRLCVQKAKDALHERREAVLAGDAEYQRLRKEWQAAEKARSVAAGRAYLRRIEVGVDGPLAFWIRAEGDNWSDVVDQIKAADKRAQP